MPPKQSTNTTGIPKLKHTRDLLKHLDPKLSIQQELILGLKLSYERFERDPKDLVIPFDAMASIAATVWEQNRGRPTDVVHLPLWVLEAIVERWLRYREVKQKGLLTTMGQVFGLESSGQGNANKVSRDTREKRDQDIAIQVAWASYHGAPIIEAKAAIAQRMGLSIDTISAIWKKKGRHATKAVQNSQGKNLEK